MSILIFLLVTYLLLCFSLQKLFSKAGIAPSKAWIPGVNFAEWCSLIGRPRWWAWLLLLPIVNFFILAGMCVDMVRSFGKYKWVDSALAVIYAPLKFLLVGNNANDKYLGKTLELESDYSEKIVAARAANNSYELKKLEANNPYAKNQAREWTEAIVFAVFAAAFIRMFLIEAYVIPTSSMEGSLLVGDYLFVSKAHYGIRTPMTVAQVPLLHNRLPIVDRESYLTQPSLPYFRLPALQTIHRNDPVVFNYPEGDSVYVFKDRAYSVYDIKRLGIAGRFDAKPLTTRPVDKQDHYIKRCVAIAGDSIEVRNRQLFINGKAAQNPSGLQFLYKITSPNTPINNAKLEEWGVHLSDANAQAGLYNLSQGEIEKIKSIGNDVTVEVVPKKVDFDGQLFPHDPIHFPLWTADNYGPLYIPQKGATIALDPTSIACYRRAISVYEHNALEERDGKFFINGREATTYTFQQDYFWMMGDNRHNSEDSRFWGYVPADHVVGKPLFIWFSTKDGSMTNGIRWNRLFTSANKM